MALWFTADLHLGHENIIRYSHRPFASADEMNDELVARWNAVVGDGDTVWVLGDVALGRIDRTLPIVDRLRGRKVLLAGNHDRCWAGHGRRADGWTNRYLSAGFDEIHQGDIRLEVATQSVLACHFPYRGDSRDGERYLAYRPVDRGDWLLHGHVHDRWRQNGRMINVGVDAWDYQPVSAEKIAELVAQGPSDRAVVLPDCAR